MRLAPLADIFQWDVRTWSRALPLWKRYLIHPPGRPALAVGERDGGLSLLLAQRGYLVTCTDLNGPSVRARDLHRARGVDRSVNYGAQDATALASSDAAFDVVMFKSVIGALGTKERQQLAISEMHRVLKPGGVLLFAENLSGTAVHRYLRKRFIPWNAYWRYLRLPADRDLFHAFALVDLGTTGFVASLGRSEGQRDLLGRIDGVLIPVIPASWRYVVYGAAVKNT